MTTTKFRMLTDQVAESLDAADLRVLEVPHPLGGTDEATIVAWADAAVDATLALFVGNDAAPTAPAATAPATPDPVAPTARADDVEAALAEVREIVAADGGDIVLESFTNGVAHLRLVLDTAECRECVMPRNFLEQIALDKMQPQVSSLTGVQIADPREEEAQDAFS